MAGNGTDGYSGDGGAATNAALNFPEGVTVDAAGNLFVADFYNNRIRKVGTNGIITTVAGNGTDGFSGDGGAATNAELCHPEGVAVDAAGNLFIADDITNRIRKVGTNGIITTVAGNGTYGYSGDGGAATNAELYFPYGVAVDASGNLFIADVITTASARWAPTGLSPRWRATGLRLLRRWRRGDQCGIDPYGVAVDAAGNLFIADTYNHASARWEPTGLSPR